MMYFFSSRAILSKKVKLQLKKLQLLRILIQKKANKKSPALLPAIKGG